MPNRTKLCNFFLFSFLFVCFLFLHPGLYAQETTEEAPAEQVEAPVKTIALSEISTETEKLGQRIRRLRDILKPLAKTSEVDSMLHTVHSDIGVERDSLLEVIEGLSQRDLREEQVHWSNYKSEFKGYQSTIDSRIKTLNGINDELVDEMKKWETTKANLSENSESTELFANLDTMILRLQDIMQLTLVRLDAIFVVQKELTQVVLLTDEVIAEINRFEMLKQKDYFVFDSPAIWNLGRPDSLSLALSPPDSLSAGQKVIVGINEDFDQLGEFINKNRETAILQIIFVLVILTLLLVVRRKWKRGENELRNPLEIEAKTVINNPVASSISVGFLVSAFFYESMTPVFSDFLVLLVLSATVYLLPKLSVKKIVLPLGIILGLIVIETIMVYVDEHASIWRILLLFNGIFLFYALIVARKITTTSPERFNRTLGFRRYALPIFMLFAILAILCNIIGMVGLSRFLISAVITSVGLGSVVYLTVKVFTSIIILIFKLRSQFNLKTISNLVEIIQKRVRPVLMFVGIIVWLLFTLIGFEVYDYIDLWVKEILGVEWKIGMMTISVGGLLSFLLIFFITMFIARIVANIFQDEWLIKVLPRGIAPALSLITRILLITTGFYMGLSAAGFDLSKVGLLVGALGVGIGFGLQSIVLNFISGLILAFERPINLGDAIEVDQEFGVVTSIGVRASNIRTYEGSEVIIPNGDLVSKKVKNWTLSNRDRRTRTLMKTSSEADPYKVIELFNKIASEHPSVYSDPAPTTHFYGFNQEGNLDFALIYWVSFSDKLSTDSEISLRIYDALKTEGIQAPIPKWKIVGGNQTELDA